MFHILLPFSTILKEGIHAIKLVNIYFGFKYMRFFLDHIKRKEGAQAWVSRNATLQPGTSVYVNSQQFTALENIDAFVSVFLFMHAHVATLHTHTH